MVEVVVSTVTTPSDHQHQPAPDCPICLEVRLDSEGIINMLERVERSDRATHTNNHHVKGSPFQVIIVLGQFEKKQLKCC